MPTAVQLFRQVQLRMLGIFKAQAYRFNWLGEPAIMLEWGDTTCPFFGLAEEPLEHPKLITYENWKLKALEQWKDENLK